MPKIGSCENSREISLQHRVVKTGIASGISSTMGSFLTESGKKAPPCFGKSENFMIFAHPNGELPEWSIGADSKSVVPFGVPGVRIPHSPP